MVTYECKMTLKIRYQDRCQIGKPAQNVGFLTRVGQPGNKFYPLTPGDRPFH
jgi:hypothetical protein